MVAPDGYEANSEDEEPDKPGKNYTFDCAAYRAAFGDMPIHKAVTSMFAEYAILYARIARQVLSRVPRPITLTEGESIFEHAKRFVTKYVRPILGPVHTSKMHKLLCHVLDAIRWHGNIQNCNTASNEGLHKDDQPYYNHTNKDPATLTRQIMTQAQGSRAILKKHAAADEKLIEATRAKVARRTAVRVAALRQNLGRAGWARRVAMQSAARRDKRRAARRISRRGYHLEKMTVSTLAARADLSGVAALLERPGEAFVRVAKNVVINATFECGTRVPQQIRANMSMNGSPWLDAVIFNDGAWTCVGELRALVRLPAGDVAIIAQLQRSPPEVGCVFTKRGCMCLRWKLNDAGDAIVVRRIPVAHIRRLAHVVPDFAELARRRGVHSVPPRLDGALHERLAMRFFLNVFFPCDQ